MSDAHPPTPFHDLDAYIDLPRGAGLKLSPDGTRLVTAVQTLNPKRTKYVTALWETDPAGEHPARRLTRSAKGETAAGFLPDGSLLFTSARPDPEAKDDEETEEALLWLLPAGGGEARVVASLSGVDGVHVAADSGRVAVSAKTFPSSETHDAEKEKRRQRKEKQVTAILHESVPVRFWDEDLGPGAPRIFTGTLTGDDSGTDPKIELSDLTPDAGRALERLEYDVSRDGSTIVTTWLVRERGGERIGLAAHRCGDRRPADPAGRCRVGVREPAHQSRREVGRRHPGEALHPGGAHRPEGGGVSRSSDGSDRETSAVTGTSGRPVRCSGRPTVRRWCSSPTRTAGRRCSGWMPSQARSPG